MGNIISGVSTNTKSSSENDFLTDDKTADNKTTSKGISSEPLNSDLQEDQFHDTMSDDEEARAKSRADEMDEFHKQLNLKREQRQKILAKHKSDRMSLENALEEERKSKIELYEQNKHLRGLLLKNNIELPDNILENEDLNTFKNVLNQLTEEMIEQKANNNKLRCDLASSNSTLQAAYSEMAELSAQNTESFKQINALKEVVAVSKTLISLRENQLNELKDKLTEIEQSLADREASMLSTDLRQEYERQLQNIRTLRGLYEERARLGEVTRQALARELEDQKLLYQAENTKCTQLTSEVEELKEKVIAMDEEIEVKNSEISACKEELAVTKSEMSVINKLFSQVLLGYKSKKDLDMLVKRLEENHGILIQMAEKENGSVISSALPKLLLELVNQVEDSNTNSEEINQQKSNVKEIDEEIQKNNKAEEIVQNLPKVWKVLIELLSHQTESTTAESEKVTTCYKSVETKSGPVLVPSVSRTYIRLKELIIEKLSLVTEVNRMKHLNGHLETRLQEQEKRLCLVTTELSKTWHVVGRLRKHHHQLHTHEKILKYELQQKRKLLNELKEELEYCREKWEQAREKNTQSEQDWKKLRAEFSSRKMKDSTNFSNSAESGYSDERPSESSDSNDESEYIPESKLKSRNKNKKSFETAIDSSADFNLAERDDPVSDMVDVADLSLDTQDDNQEVFDDSCNSEHLKSDKICDESEDEAVEICNDSCQEDISMSDTNQHFDNTEARIEHKTINYVENTTFPPSAQSLHTIPTSSNQIDLNEQEMLNNVNKQNESYKLKDRQLEDIKYSTTVANTSNLLNEACMFPLQEDALKRSEESVNEDSNASCSVTNKISEVDFKTILQNIKKQDEHLAKKDMRLDNLESNCSEVLTNIKTVVNNSDKLLKQLNAVHKKYTTQDEVQCTEDQKDSTKLSEASTSTDIDHEARFAARDLRLKRLEEQTKSLVNKVNDTTTKGVKIHYKLEELHSIYGSDNSRSGTPSDEMDAPETNEENNENN